MPAGPAWWDTVRARATVADVAAALGLSDGKRGTFGPCPACNGDRRGSADRRAPVGVTGDGHGWCCFPCGAKGDALDLAALRVAGAALGGLDAKRRGEVRAWFAGRGWCEPAPPLSPLGMVAAELFGELPPKGDPRWRVAGRDLKRREAAGEAPRPLPVEPPPVVRLPRSENRARNANENPAKPPPPLEEVAALWAACRPVNGPGCAAVAGDWLREVRGLNPDAVAALDLVRVLPDVYPWPGWLPLVGMDRGAWLEVYRLAAPMYDVAGELRAIRFRAVDRVRELDPDADPPRLRWRVLPVKKKALAPIGARLAGLVLADPWGLALLRGAREVDGVPWDGAVLVAEGEIDLCAATSSAGRFRAGGTFAAFAVAAGSWTPEIAARIPDGARVTVATDADGPGDKYAETVRASLAGRCKVLRMVARPETWGNNAER